MNSRLKILLEAAAGAIGGFIAWAIMEPIPFLTSDDERVVEGAAIWSLILFGAIMGGWIGAGIGAVEGLSTGSRRQFNRALAVGAGLGVAGGMAGLYFGQTIYAILLTLVPQPSGGAAAVVMSPLAFLLSVVARSAGWALVGLFVGASMGVPSGSLRKMKHGLIGGVVGGALGGALFELVGHLFPGEICRLIGITVTGFFVGFFIGLVQDLMKQAWVIVLKGRNEGREYILDKPENSLGRDELSDVGVFGDPSVAPQHARIVNSNGQFIVEDLGNSPAGTVVNGQRVSRQGLANGDLILLGGARIEFHEKAGSAPVRRPVDVAAPARPRPALPDNLCAFCGQTKDPRTGACACTPVAAPTGFAAAAESASGASFGGQAASMPPYKPESAPGTPAAGGPRLVGVAGPMSGQVVPLAAPEVSIGRDASRDVVLAGDGTASRRHAVLRAHGGGYAIADEGSANGTFVNGARVTDQPLRPGDRVRIGQSEFLYEQ